jgi:type 1 glutamine amidotransferase
MKANLKIGLLALFAVVASWLACTGGTEVGNKIPSTGSGGSAGPGTGGDMSTGTGGDASTGMGGTTGAGGAIGGGGSGGVAGAGGATGTGGRGGMGGSAAGGAGGGMAGPIKVLIWNNALTYGHQSRMTAIPLLQARQATDNIMFDVKYAHTASLAEGVVDSSSDPSVFTDAGLDPYDVVFFLNTTGNTMDQDGQANTHRQALINFIKKGRGYVGTHSATDTYQGTNWPWYVDFMGANFNTHSPVNTQGTARYYMGMTHPILMAAGTPNPWSRSEEWYTLTRDPLSSAIPGIKILLTCTDNSITTERAITWVHEMPLEPGAPRQGRMFYTAFGHFVAAFNEKAVMDMIVAGIKWAAYRI